MARSISYLTTGSKIIDSMGQTYIVIAQNHYKNGQTTVWTENCVTSMKMSSLTNGVLNYESTDVNSYLKNHHLSKINKHNIFILLFIQSCEVVNYSNSIFVREGLYFIRIASPVTKSISSEKDILNLVVPV